MPSLEDLIKEREKKMKDLYDSVDAEIEKHSYGNHTIRKFVVELYDENTEAQGCLAYLADIAKWFRVYPLNPKKKEE